MTRDEAFSLASDVADAGFSCSVAIGVHPKMTPREHCSVSVHAMRFEAVALQALIEIGTSHNLGLHLIGNELAFIAEQRSGARR
jgi:predicted metal-dependent TIM-barrel fold hydrolase